MFRLLGQRAALRLGGHVDDVAFDVELPAVIETAQAAFLVASESKRGLAVRTKLAKQTELSFAVAERHEFLAKELDAHRRTAGFCNLFGEKRRDPVTPHQSAHRRIGFDP